MTHTHTIDSAAFAQIKEKATNVEVIKTSRIIQKGDEVIFQEADTKGEFTGLEVAVRVILSVASTARPGIAKDHTLVSWNDEENTLIETKMPVAPKVTVKGPKVVPTVHATGTAAPTVTTAPRTRQRNPRPSTPTIKETPAVTAAAAGSPDPVVEPVVDSTDATDNKIPDENLF